MINIVVIVYQINTFLALNFSFFTFSFCKAREAPDL